MNLDLNESLFEKLNTDVSYYENDDYLNILNKIELVEEPRGEDIIEIYEYSISILEGILEEITDEYENMKESVERNLRESYWEYPIDAYWEGIYSELEELVDEKDVQQVFDEIYEFSGTYSKLTINDLTQLTQKMIKELEIENNVRWDREYILIWEMLLEDPLYEIQQIHNKVTDELKNRIDNYSEQLKNITDIFIF